MKWFTLTGLLLTIGCGSLQANDPYKVDSYYSGNHWSPYPPGCITVPLRQLDLYGDNVALIFDDTVDLKRANAVAGTNPNLHYIPVPMKMYRIGCAEENRSVILVEFSLASKSVDGSSIREIEVPDVIGSTAFHGVPFVLNPEPNFYGQHGAQMAQTRRTFGDYTGGWSDAGYFTWRFVLDTRGPWGSEYYNDRFGLEFRIAGYHPGIWRDFDVPSTQSVLNHNPELPLNGRLSGNWIEGGTRDQGFLLSIGNLALGSSSQSQPENSDLVVFLAWYTFDSNGKMLWLTASSTASQGSSTIDLQFVQVNNGEFLGERIADRSVVGSGRLKARNCNLLELDYDLSALGLGQGSMNLNRIFSLEIAGYPCRDYAARMESLYGKESN